MTAEGPEEQPPSPTPVVPPDLRLRGERPRVTRLSRRVLIGLGAVSALAVAGALGYGLQKDYTGLPRQVPPLGPPLPGDLGKPILNAGAAPNTVTPGTTPDPEAQRRAQEIEAARLSCLFAQTNQQPQPVGLAAPAATGTTAGPTPTPPVDAGAAQNMQDRKTAFLNASTDKRTVSPDRLDAKASPYVVQAGTVIPAALITGIRSDLPGQITAQVTENIYDTPTGRARLIPQGARLIGVYDSQVAFGQSRVLLVWTRLIMPNGRSIVLERQQGADAGGYSGLEDEVDNHWGELFKAALLSTLLGVGAELGSGADTGSNTNILQALRLGAANSLNQTGQQVVRRNLNIQPTLTIRPGFAVRVMVNRDLVLEPYSG